MNFLLKTTPFLLALLTASLLDAEPGPIGSVDELETFFKDDTVRRQSVRISGILQRKTRVHPLWELTVKEASGRRAAFYTNVEWPTDSGDQLVVDGYATLYPNLETYLTATNVAVVGRSTVDPPLVLRLHDLDERAHHLCEIVVCGTVVDIRDDEIDPHYGIIQLKDDDLLLPVYFRKDDLGLSLTPESAIEAQVTVRGIFHRTLNGERKFFGPFLHLVRSTDLTIVAPPPADPFSAPHLNDLLYLSPKEILRLGRRTVTGSVLACWDGETFLLRTDKGLLVNVELRDDFQQQPPVNGRVTAVGYPDTDRFHLILTRAIFKVTDQPAAPAAEKSEPLSANAILQTRQGKEFVNSRYHGKLVSLYGTLRSISSPSSPNRRAYVESKDFHIPVEFSVAPDAFNDIEIGSRVCITGRCVLETENSSTFNAYPKAKGILLVIRTADDIEVIEHPPWWTPGKLFLIIGLLLTALLGLALRSHFLKHISRLKIAERTALAVELHDSLSQSLAGLACQIAAVGDALTDRIVLAKNKLKNAEQMLDSCRAELRNCLFDLRSDTIGEKDFAQAVRRTLEAFEGYVLVTIRFNVRRSGLDDATAHATLAIIRELTANAVRHGNAGSVKIAGAAAKEELHFSVTDDGCGFNPEQRPGIAEGHFGLNGICDRVRRLNGTIEIKSIIGNGTKVIVTMPLKSK